jgi:hypothetical protein
VNDRTEVKFGAATILVREETFWNVELSFPNGPRFSLHNFPVHVELVSLYDSFQQHYKWEVVLHVCDRVTKRPTTIRRIFLVDRYVADREPTYFSYAVHCSILEVLRHELDEAFHFQGERIYDPHKDEP